MFRGRGGNVVSDSLGTAWGTATGSSSAWGSDCFKGTPPCVSYLGDSYISGCSIIRKVLTAVVQELGSCSFVGNLFQRSRLHQGEIVVVVWFPLCTAAVTVDSMVKTFVSEVHTRRTRSDTFGLRRRTGLWHVQCCSPMEGALSGDTKPNLPF